VSPEPKVHLPWVFAEAIDVKLEGLSLRNLVVVAPNPL
jgi:hypothetical protein